MENKTSNKGISVIICTYNGKERIGSAIDSVLAQEVRSSINWELIIIDNSSTDQTYEWVYDYLSNKNSQFDWRVISESKRGSAMARVRSLFESKYEWILFVDDDNQLFRDYMECGWKILLSNRHIGVLGGCGIAKFESMQPEWFEKHSLSFAVGPQSSSDGPISRFSKRKLHSAGSFFKKEILLKYYSSGLSGIMSGRMQDKFGGGEDNEWCMMIELAGYSLWYSSDLKFFHSMPNSRMQWDYFVKLKKGISGSSGKLIAYLPFYFKKDPGFIYFFSFYLKELIFFQFLLIKHKITFKQCSPEKKLGKEIIFSKAASYRYNIFNSGCYFLRLKKVLKEVQNF